MFLPATVAITSLAACVARDPNGHVALTPRQVFVMTSRAVLIRRTVEARSWYSLVSVSRAQPIRQVEAYLYEGYAAVPPRYRHITNKKSVFTVTPYGFYDSTPGARQCGVAGRSAGAGLTGESATPGLPSHPDLVSYGRGRSIYGHPAWHLRIRYLTALTALPYVAAPPSGRVTGDLWVSMRTHLPVLFRSVSVGRPVEWSKWYPEVRNVIQERFISFGIRIPRLSLPAICSKG
jgi:hypothetical protein